MEGADDGTKAVQRVRESPFDLILMDVRMAVMSGIEALKRTKQYNPSIPILIMTAFSSVKSAVEALKAGAYDYLTKPLVSFKSVYILLYSSIFREALPDRLVHDYYLSAQVNMRKLMNVTNYLYQNRRDYGVDFWSWLVRMAKEA